MAQKDTPGGTGMFDEEMSYDEMMSTGKKAATDRILAVKNQEVDAFGLPTTRRERERRKQQVEDDVMTGFALSPQGKAAAALEKKKMRRTPKFAVGAKGAGVGELQEFLKNEGFYMGSIDNDFGDQTKAAVEAYQRSKGLTADGMVGTNTMAAITADKAGSPPAAAPAAPMAAAPAAPAAPEPAVAATESRAGRMTPGAQLRKIRSGEMALRAEDLPNDQNVLEFLVTRGLVDVDTATRAGYRPTPGAMKKKTPAAASRPVAQPGAAAPVATSTPATAASGDRAPTADEIKMMTTAQRRAVIDSGLMTAAEMAAALMAGNT